MKFHGGHLVDATAVERQKRRLARLASEGVKATSVLVHHGCNAAFQELRPYFADPKQSELLVQLLGELKSRATPTNVSQIPQLSPLRYPGGKTWLVPEIRAWIKGLPSRRKFFVEPFAGGAIAGLTVAAENLAEGAILVERDPAVAALWAVVVHGNEEDVEALFKRVLSFEMTTAAVDRVLNVYSSTLVDRAFSTIVKNRVHRGGILAPGASRMKAGENGKGLMSRWYPETLVKRMRAIRAIRSRLRFVEGDAFAAIRKWRHRKQAVWFVDPPYTAGEKKAGSRLYAYNEVDHERLFCEIAECRGPAMLTYDDSKEVRQLASKYAFQVREIPMKTTHHEIKNELLLLKA
ncbi:MAG: DNA adenine methylase [Burkholderiales bacterium]